MKNEIELWKEGDLSLWLYVDTSRSIRIYLWKNKSSMVPAEILKSWYRPLFKERAIRRAMRYARQEAGGAESKEDLLMRRLREVASIEDWREMGLE